MDDLISRQPGITKRNAETEQDVSNGDLISRKAAIEALESIGSVDTEADKEFAIEIFEALPSVQEQRWIPVKMRPMDSEEREYWEDQFGEKLEDEDAVMFDCPMPDDG